MRLCSSVSLWRSLCVSAGIISAAALPATAATYDVFKAGTAELLGAFEAPAAGGLLTAASISVKGGVFDVLALGGMAPVFDAGDMDVDGNGAAFGSLFNSIAFLTTDLANNPVNCGIGECAFSFEGSFGGTPGEWYLDYIGGGGPEALSFGHYDVTAAPPAPVPLPMTALFLLGGLVLLWSLRSGDKRPATARV